MLRLYLSRSPHFYSDWLWPYSDSCLSILPKKPAKPLVDILFICYGSHLKNKERKIKIKLLEVWLITTVTLCQFTSIFTSYCKAYIELHNGAKNINELFLYIQISRLTLKVLDHFTLDVQVDHFQSPYCWHLSKLDFCHV